MATLANGLETVDLGGTAWRVIYNTNFENLYTKAEIDDRDSDITFTNDTDGVILQDRTTATSYRLYVDSGVLSIEAM